MFEEVPEDPNRALQLVLIGAVVAGAILVVTGLFFVPSGTDVGSSEIGRPITASDQSTSVVGERVSSASSKYNSSSVMATSSRDAEYPVELSLVKLPDEKLLTLLTVDNKDINSILVAVDEAGKRDYDTVIPALLNLSQHEDFHVRLSVVKVFGSSVKFKTKEVLKVMIRALSDEHELVRGLAVQIISGLNNKAALRLLEERQKTEDNQSVRRLISEGISKIRESVTVP